ncbi:MAG: hypothetical protein P8J25_00330, partial [Porticoccaceae bacterium]|nr:hypothetical protein [Porticoccaceae bacterium]
QNNQLKVQYELADVLQQWNKIKVSKDIVNITSSDLPTVASVDGLNFYAGSAKTNATAATSSSSSSGFSLAGTSLFAATTPVTSVNYARLIYGPFKNSSLCESLKNTFNDDMVGIIDSDCSFSSSGHFYLVIFTN